MVRSLRSCVPRIDLAIGRKYAAASNAERRARSVIPQAHPYADGDFETLGEQLKAFAPRPLLEASMPRARRQLLPGGVSRFGGEPVAKHSPAEGLCLSVRARGHVPDVTSSAVDRVADRVS